MKTAALLAWGKAESMSDSVIYIVTLIILLALAGLAYWIARQGAGFDGMKLFQSKQRRIGVVETAVVDGRRRLIILRRDNVEHLIMTGGPVDVVIETGIPARHVLANGLGDVLARADEATGVGHKAFEAGDQPLAIQLDPRN
jgi:hypothetical protein